MTSDRTQTTQKVPPLPSLVKERRAFSIALMMISFQDQNGEPMFHPRSRFDKKIEYL